MDNSKQNMMTSLKRISTDRQRTNILRSSEQKAIAYLVQRVPSWISSDGLTAIGFLGNITVALSLVLAAYINRYWLLLSLVGFVVNWFGDSLDGRLAYYRKKPRKWYGFSLDITVDWLGIILIGAGYMIYAVGAWKYVGFAFVVLYGWEMITAQLRYKITGQYSIDSGILGPTEVRIILAFIFILEVIIPTSIYYLASLACVVLVVSNIKEAKHLLHVADLRDKEEKKAKEQEQNSAKAQNA
ncbi:MAG: CDP-alcohol phosphatidyltransferase family protein [Fermentimonas sp.]|jgi:phosphatidylglycerophosphate synthase